MPSRTRIALLALTPLLLGACGEHRPAVPLAASIPLATIILGAAAAPMWLMARWAWSRPASPVDLATGWYLPAGPIRRTRTVALVAAIVVAVPAFALAGWLIAFSFAEAHIGLFSYGEVVGFSAVLVGLACVVWCVLLAAAGALCSPDSTRRRCARVGAWVATVASAPLVTVAVPIALVLPLMLFTSRRVVPEPHFETDVGWLERDSPISSEG